MILFPGYSPIIIDWTIPSSIENIREKGSEEVPYFNERFIHTISFPHKSGITVID